MAKKCEIKLSDLIRQYDGSSDCLEWIKKFELVMKLQNFKDYECVLPLFLSGGAFSVYDSMSEEEKADYGKIKATLIRAFSKDAFMAYEEFINRKLKLGESVDIFVADLKRLNRLISEFASEDFIKCAFVNGLPEYMRSQIKASCGLEILGIDEIVAKARVLQKVMEETCPISSAFSNQACLAAKDVKKSFTCFNCGGENHIARFCPKARPHYFKKDSGNEDRKLH